ncbi:MAG: ABC transporter permease [Nitrososphaerota archaeon]|nr:ABC transporter permease [Nitrososphaerota archaeon]
MSILLITVSFVGNFVCWNTTRGYADSAFDQNVLIVGNAYFVDVYQKMLNPITNVDQNKEVLSEVKFADSSYMISKEFIEQLNMVNGIVSIDKRFVVFTRVMEVRRMVVELDKFNEPHYVTYGEYRSTDCVVVGINPDQLINENILQKLGISTLGRLDNAVVGDSLAEAIFQNPYKQDIEVYSYDSAVSSNFNITNVVIDPLNHGYGAYVPVSELQKLFAVDGFNFILVKVDDHNSSTVLELTSLAAKYGLVVSSLDSLHNEYISSIDKLWLSILPFTVLTVITAMICLLNCMFVSISSRFHDFGIIRAIGAKSSYIPKIVFFECLILTLAAAPIGIILGTTFDLLFLLPVSTLSLPFLLYSLTAIIGILFGMCYLCTLIVIRLKKRNPHELLQ